MRDTQNMRLQKRYKGNLIAMSVKPVRDRQLLGGLQPGWSIAQALCPALQTDIPCAWLDGLLGPLMATWNLGSWAELSASRRAQRGMESGCLSIRTHGVSTQAFIWSRDLWLQVYHCIGRSYWLADNVLSQSGKKEKVPLGTNCGINSLPDYQLNLYITSSYVLTIYGFTPSRAQLTV